MSVDWRRLAGYGFSLVPVARRRPIVKWRDFQARRPTEAELAQWARRPSNAAIVTGQISGVIVLDVDTDEAAAEVAQRGLPRTPTVRTAKGRHYYFRHPGGRIGNFGYQRLNGCDLKGDGGLVTAPGSVHPSGVVYAWELSPDEVEFAEPPAWLLELARERPEPAPTQTPRSTADAYAGAAMDRELAALRHAAKGERNKSLNRAAHSLGQIVGAGALDEVTVERHLLATAHSIGLGSEEARATVRSGLSAGKAEPRQIPEFGTRSSGQADNVVPFAPRQPAAEDASLDIDAELARLAALDLVAYDWERGAACERLEVRTSTLDKLVAGRRAQANGAAGVNGTVMTLDPPEPWPEPVDGAWLLDELAAAVRRYVVMPPMAADAVALWVVHAHCHDAAACSPILAVVSPEKRSGKTVCLDLLHQLTPKPMAGANVTAAALFRAIEKWRPTLLLDEVETFLLPENEDLRGVLNSGHRKATACIIRCVGEDHEPRHFSTWAPKVLALIGKLPPTLTDRSIQIPLKRKRTEDKVERFRSGRLPPLLAELTRKAARWAADHLAELAGADPVTPDALNDRARDNWELLIAIADRAGSGWGERARRAAVALSGDDAAEDQSAGVMLLADIREIFETDPAAVVAAEDGAITQRIRSTTVAEALARMETRPWAEWGKARKPISPNAVARLLKPYGIRPDDIRVGPENFKGYERRWFDDAFARYLPRATVTPRHPNEIKELEENQTATSAGHVTVVNADKSLKNNGCHGVTVANPPASEEEGDDAELDL